MDFRLQRVTNKGSVMVLNNKKFISDEKVECLLVSMIFFIALSYQPLYLLATEHINERKSNRTEESKTENVDVYNSV